MRIEERKVTVGEVCDGYFNDAEEGVVGYGERLDIRPRYQREFVYKDKQRDEVIRTVMKAPSHCASTLTVLSRSMTSTSTICPRTRREKYSIIGYSFTFATARTLRSSTGSALSTSRVSS